MVATQERTVSVWRDTIQPRVKIAGSGPPVVFFHGATGLQWDPFLDALAEHFTVYAPEHPGTSPGDPDGVKPLDNLVRRSGGTKGGGLVQPGLKVRGREYLRIIYGPEYTQERHLERLRDRSLGRKRSLALREYALGLEALDRVVRGEPLWRVHEAVFAVLALESEPVDPRL